MSEGPVGIGNGARVRRWIWTLGVALLLASVVGYWLRIPASTRWRVPHSPLDNMAGFDPIAPGWGLLWQARDVLPPGASYTVRASDPQVEFKLYMLSIGVLTECRAFPSSYYGTLQPDAAARARYVIALGCSGAPSDAVLVQKLDAGCIYDRGVR